MHTCVKLVTSTLCKDFRREFDNVATMVCLSEDSQDNQIIDSSVKINYLRFKEFLITMGLLSE